MPPVSKEGFGTTALPRDLPTPIFPNSQSPSLQKSSPASARQPLSHSREWFGDPLSWHSAHLNTPSSFTCSWCEGMSRPSSLHEFLQSRAHGCYGPPEMWPPQSYLRGLLLEIKSGGTGGKESAGNAGDLGSMPGSGRYPGVGNGYPLQYSCLEHPMDRGAWRAAVHGVRKRRT